MVADIIVVVVTITAAAAITVGYYGRGYGYWPRYGYWWRPWGYYSAFLPMVYYSVLLSVLLPLLVYSRSAFNTADLH